jgi:hypothetical protein
VYYSQVYINEDVVGTTDQGSIQATMTHELGHVLVLAHYPSTNSVMYGAYSPSRPTTPGVVDIGNYSLPLCSEDPEPGGGDSLITVRCIYGW